MLTIFTDTDTDITPVEAAKYGYKLISMPYAVDDKTVYPYVDFDTFDDHAFYDMLRKGVLPTTSAISEEKYTAYFEPDFAAGNDILYVHFSAAMTVTFDNMHRALEALSKKYPERRFYEIDTKGITTLSYVIVREVGELVLAGKSAEEILAWAKEEVDHFTIYFYADNLKFFGKSGRVSGLTAAMGNLLGVRPIIYMNDEGKMVSIGKERGRANALNRLVQYVADLGSDLKNHCIVIGHTDSLAIAQQVETMLRARLGEDLNIEIHPVNPTAGSHCGPDGVGICFHAVHR